MNIRLARTSVSNRPPVVTYTMSKTLRIAIATVVATAIRVPRIIGTTMRRNTDASPAPSIRAASMTSLGTPFSAADRTTIANPVWSQIMITIRASVLSGGTWSHGTGSLPSAGPDRVDRPDLRLAFRLPRVHEPPDDGRADHADREWQEDERLGQRLALDPIDKGRDQQTDDDAAARAQHEPHDVVAERQPHLGRGQDEPPVRDETLVLGRAGDDRQRPPVR